MGTLDALLGCINALREDDSVTLSATAILDSEARTDSCIGVTLLELVVAAGATTDSDEGVTTQVRHLLQSGRVRLTGNFAGAPIEQFLEPAFSN